MADFKALVDDVIEDGKVDAKEVAVLRETLYADGKIDEEEANGLFKINDACSGADNDPGWAKLFVGAITRYVLEDDTSPGEIDEGEAKWLIDNIKGDGKVDDVELALLVNICVKATAESPDFFNAFILDSVKAAVVDDGIVDAEEVEMMKKVIYGAGGAGGAGVDQAEGNMLFDINDATTDKQGHDASWKAFFVEALSKCVLEDETSPGVIDADEAKWLVERIKGDGVVDANELALLVNICETATGESPDFFNAFILDSVKAAVVEDGIVDAEEVELMKKVVYGAGGAGGAAVDQAEGDMIFAINDATTDKQGHDASWQAFFVEALSKCVLEDETSPGEIDADEAKWLIDNVMGDGQVDANERALLVNIKAKATAIDATLQAKMDELGI